tara:strand:- start:693 stop:812 length:120 start_codon:yes stop_codon:yes gene_type:complete
MKNDREIKRLRKIIFNLQIRGDYKAANKLLKRIEELKNG